MTELRGYQKAIAEATGVTDPAIIEQIETHMREDVFHSTLDWQSKAQFNKGAREAFKLWCAFHPEATDAQIINAHFITKADRHWIRTRSVEVIAEAVSNIRIAYAKMREEVAA